MTLSLLQTRSVVRFVSRPDAALETVERITEKGGKAETVQFNVADFDEVQTAISECVKREGHIDILVNNAGITRDGLLMKMREDAWDVVIDTNLKGAFNCVKAVSRSMMKSRWGRIINIASVIGFSGNAGQVNYAAAKAGLVGLTKSLARELSTRGITVNGVAPGFIETDMTDGLSEEVINKILSEIPLARLGQSDDVAAAVAYLASDDASYVTGQFIHVNGGMYM